MRRKINIILIIVCIAVLCIYIFINNIKFEFLKENILFLKFFGNNFISVNSNNSNNNVVKVVKKDNQLKNRYIFNVKYGNTYYDGINLLNTINTETLVEEKIAPGVKGSFEILIYSNYNTKYNVLFKSKSESPENLKFSIKNKNLEYRSLEELSNELDGIIYKGEQKLITIDWEWSYENGNLGNIQDTKDAKLIDKYVFNILAVGNEII